MLAGAIYMFYKGISVNMVFIISRSCPSYISPCPSCVVALQCRKGPLSFFLSMCKKERIWRQQKCLACPSGTANTSRVHSPLFAIIHIWQPRNVTPELLGLPLSRYMARVFHIWSYLPCRLFSFLLMWAIWQFGVVSKLSQKQTPLCYCVWRMEMETFSLCH